MKVFSESSLSLPYARHRGRTRTRNVFHPKAQGLTYLMAIKDCFTKEWQGYNFSRSCLMNAVRAMGYVVIRVFDREVPDGLILRTDISPNISQHFRKAIIFYESNWNTSKNTRA
ncbi:MAG: hypothetical protein QXP36_06065 [Conexivisphaerales archaeon]